jgi:hypothetical protein
VVGKKDTRKEVQKGKAKGKGKAKARRKAKAKDSEEEEAVDSGAEEEGDEDLGRSGSDTERNTDPHADEEEIDELESSARATPTLSKNNESGSEDERGEPPFSAKLNKK